MSQAVKNKIPSLLKIVFELRYRQGFVYLDRCGRTINLIQEYYPDWIVASGQPNAQVASMVNVATGTKFNFNSLKLDISLDRQSDGKLDQADIERFAAETEELSGTVVDQLSLAEFSRIGCRIWFLLPSESMEEANEFLQSLQLFTVSPTVLKAFKGSLEAVSFAATLVGEDRKFRFSAENSERVFEVDLGDVQLNVPIQALPSKDRPAAIMKREKAKSRMRRNPAFATIIDVDAYRDNPEILKPAEFILSSFAVAEKSLHAASTSSL